MLRHLITANYFMLKFAILILIILNSQFAVAQTFSHLPQEPETDGATNIEKQTEIQLLLKDAQITKQEQELEVQKIILFYTFCILTLAMILAFVMFNNWRRIKSNNRKLKNRNDEIRAQAEQLNNLNAAKDKLFSIISHDLRSPVASLKALMSIMGKSNLSEREFVSTVEKLKSRLDSVYDDLDNMLEWAQSQLKGLQVNTESFDLKLLADLKIELFREAARIKSITLINDIEKGSYVLADKNHISLALRNLLANAIKFTPYGGCVRVYCSDQDEQMEISISDSGIGMCPEELSRLFDTSTHFTKRGTNDEKGAGIGLLLTKEFVENNGGSLSVQSEAGKGSTFSFSLKRDMEKAVMLELFK